MHLRLKGCISLLLLKLCLLSVACGPRQDLAPVVEVNWKAANPNQKKHVVVRGETLYAVAFRYDKDYRALASLNRLQPPYTLKVGQTLKLTGPKPSTPLPSRPSVQPQQKASIFKSPHAPWRWPATGKVIGRFAPKQGKKGIDISGKRGSKIHAAADGVVAYAGRGLPGYGNLIIIKHDYQFLTAYGNNVRNLVEEGQTVKSGQIIAEMGVVDRRFWGLHFEIRQSGKPVNPMRYLKKA